MIYGMEKSRLRARHELITYKLGIITLEVRSERARLRGVGNGSIRRLGIGKRMQKEYRTRRLMNPLSWAEPKLQNDEGRRIAVSFTRGRLSLYRFMPVGWIADDRGRAHAAALCGQPRALHI